MSDGAPQTISSMEATVLSIKLDHVGQRVDEIVKLVEKMQTTMQALVVVAEQQRDFRSALDRAFKIIDKNADRLNEIERQLPDLQKMRRLVMWAIVSAAAMAGAAIFNILVIQPLYRGYGSHPASNTTIITPAQPHPSAQPDEWRP